MPRIATFTFEGWEGPVLMPTAKGSRPSRIRTSALVKDAVDAWLIATQYAALVSAGGSHEIETAAGTPIQGVRIARVVITGVRKKLMRGDGVDPRTHQLDAAWELYV